MSVYEMAIQLGKMLSTTDEYQRVLETQGAVARDKDARAVVKDFQQLQTSYRRMQMSGHQLSQENLNTLAEAEKKASANPLVMEYLTAQANFYDVVNEVNEKIQEGLKGKAQEEESQAQGGCSCTSNDSGSCGGSCSGC